MPVQQLRDCTRLLHRWYIHTPTAHNRTIHNGYRIRNLSKDYVKREEYKPKIAATRYPTCGRRPHRGQGTRFTILLPASVSTSTTGDVPFSIFFQGYLKLLINTLRKYDCHGGQGTCPHLSFRLNEQQARLPCVPSNLPRVKEIDSNDRKAEKAGNRAHVASHRAATGPQSKWSAQHFTGLSSRLGASRRWRWRRQRRRRWRRRRFGNNGPLRLRAVYGRWSADRRSKGGRTWKTRHTTTANCNHHLHVVSRDAIKRDAGRSGGGGGSSTSTTTTTSARVVLSETRRGFLP